MSIFNRNKDKVDSDNLDLNSTDPRDLLKQALMQLSPTQLAQMNNDERLLAVIDAQMDAAGYDMEAPEGKPSRGWKPTPVIEVGALVSDGEGRIGIVTTLDNTFESLAPLHLMSTDVARRIANALNAAVDFCEKNGDTTAMNPTASQSGKPLEMPGQYL